MAKRRQKRKAVIFLILLVLFLLFTLFGRYLAPHDPYETNLSAALLKPSAEYPFGTDNLGRAFFRECWRGRRHPYFPRWQWLLWFRYSERQLACCQVIWEELLIQLL